MESFKCIIQHIIINIVFDIHSFCFFWGIIRSFLFWWAMGISLNHIYNRFQNYCYKSTIQFLATNMFVLHACLQNVNYICCVTMVPSWRSHWKKMAFWIKMIYRVNYKLTIIPVCGLAVIQDAVWFVYVRYFFGF